MRYWDLIYAEEVYVFVYWRRRVGLFLFSVLVQE